MSVSIFLQLVVSEDGVEPSVAVNPYRQEMGQPAQGDNTAEYRKGVEVLSRVLDFAQAVKS